MLGDSPAIARHATRVGSGCTQAPEKVVEACDIAATQVVVVAAAQVRKRDFCGHKTTAKILHQSNPSKTFAAHLRFATCPYLHLFIFTSFILLPFVFYSFPSSLVLLPLSHPIPFSPRAMN
ncbi:hypothetical protein RIF29_42368 [Crotalaria pallida]|uniref:Uncharacterized protein n=1 Tax=Crotalaria pallida TaxID=3830 RepID=A0AAN9HQ82_CROPI